MGKKSTPQPPDLAPAANASMDVARIQQQTAQEQLAWAREQDDRNQAVLREVLDEQMAIQDETSANARKDRERYEQTYQPLEDNLIKEFQEYDSPERQDLERGRAVADVNTAFDAQRRNALQRLEGYGVDPSQTRNAALDIGVRTQQAASQAAAASGATRNVENTGRALRAEAINIGKGMPSQVAASYGQSIAAGNSGVGNANSTTSTGANALTSGNAAMGQALQGYNQSANIQSQGFNNQMAAHSAQQQASSSAMSGIGQIAGMAAMFMREGGHVPRRSALPFSKDGPVNEGPSDGSGIDDQVPAMLSRGEFVIPADVVEKLGTQHFQKLLEKYHVPAETQEDIGMANGGYARVQSMRGVGVAPPAQVPRPQPAQQEGTWNGRPISSYQGAGDSGSMGAGPMGRMAPQLIQQVMQQPQQSQPQPYHIQPQQPQQPHLIQRYQQLNQSAPPRRGIIGPQTSQRIAAMQQMYQQQNRQRALAI